MRREGKRGKRKEEEKEQEKHEERYEGKKKKENIRRVDYKKNYKILCHRS